MEQERERLQLRVEQLITEQAQLLEDNTDLEGAGMPVAEHAQAVAQARAIETEPPE